MAVKTWDNTSGGAWTTAANWSPAGIPGAGDDVVISALGSYRITLPIVSGLASYPVNSLTLSAPGATLVFDATPLAVGSKVQLNAGTVIGGMISGGTVVLNGAKIISTTLNNTLI